MAALPRLRVAAAHTWSVWRDGAFADFYAVQRRATRALSDTSPCLRAYLHRRRVRCRSVRCVPCSSRQIDRIHVLLYSLDGRTRDLVDVRHGNGLMVYSHA